MNNDFMDNSRTKMFTVEYEESGRNSYMIVSARSPEEAEDLWYCEIEDRFGYVPDSVIGPLDVSEVSTC